MKKMDFSKSRNRSPYLKRKCVCRFSGDDKDILQDTSNPRSNENTWINKLLKIYAFEKDLQYNYYEKHPDKFTNLFSLTYLTSYLYSTNQKSNYMSTEWNEVLSILFSSLLKKVIATEYIWTVQESRIRANFIVNNNSFSKDLSCNSVQIDQNVKSNVQSPQQIKRKLFKESDVQLRLHSGLNSNEKCQNKQQLDFFNILQHFKTKMRKNNKPDNHWNINYQNRSLSRVEFSDKSMPKGEIRKSATKHQTILIHNGEDSKQIVKKWKQGTRQEMKSEGQSHILIPSKKWSNKSMIEKDISNGNLLYKEDLGDPIFTPDDINGSEYLMNNISQISNNLYFMKEDKEGKEEDETQSVPGETDKKLISNNCNSNSNSNNKTLNFSNFSSSVVQFYKDCNNINSEISCSTPVNNSLSNRNDNSLDIPKPRTKRSLFGIHNSNYEIKGFPDREIINNIIKEKDQDKVLQFISDDDGNKYDIISASSSKASSINNWDDAFLNLKQSSQLHEESNSCNSSASDDDDDDDNSENEEDIVENEWSLSSSTIVEEMNNVLFDLLENVFSAQSIDNSNINTSPIANAGHKDNDNKCEISTIEPDFTVNSQKESECNFVYQNTNHTKTIGCSLSPVHEVSQLWDDISPTTINSFKYIMPLAKGGYGKVDIFKKVTTGDYYAIKTVDISAIKEKNMISSLKNETLILNKINSEFAVKCYYIFKDDVNYYYVMEYMPGGDVFQLWKNIELPVKTIQLITAEVLWALFYLHSNNIIHKDIKPNNILISKDGHFKLTDFGLSEAERRYNKYAILYDGNEFGEDSEGQEDSDKIVGTWNYMAPEIFEGNEQTPSVDFWAVGVWIFELYTFKVPFFGNTPAKTRDNICNWIIDWTPFETEEIKKSYSNLEDARDLINKFLQKNPNDRWGDDNIDDIKRHKFFDGLNWDNIRNIRDRQIWLYVKNLVEKTNKEIRWVSKRKSFSRKKPNWNSTSMTLAASAGLNSFYVQRVDNWYSICQDVLKGKFKKAELGINSEDDDTLLEDIK